MIVIKYLWYYTMWTLVKVGLHFYFSKIKVSGKHHIPKNTPIIFGSNHENAFIDALLITTSNTRFDHYLVRAGVFKNPIAKAILNSLNLMPVYRAQDGVNPLLANKQIFRACFEALAKKYSVMLFPEGEHNMRRHRRVLKKGIARIALGAVNFEDQTQEVSVVPVGVNYSDHTGFRSTVHIVFGESVIVQKQEENAENYNKLTARITEALSQVHVSLDREEYLGLDAIFFHDQDAHAIVEPEKINAAARKLVGRSVEVHEIAEQKMSLENAGMCFPFRSTTAGDQLKLVLLFPLAAVGLMVNFLVLLPVNWFVRTRVKEAEFVASLKFGFSFLGISIWSWHLCSWVYSYTGQWYLALTALFFNILSIVSLNGFLRKWKRFRMTHMLSSNDSLRTKYGAFVEKINLIRAELF